MKKLLIAAITIIGINSLNAALVDQQCVASCKKTGASEEACNKQCPVNVDISLKPYIKFNPTRGTGGGTVDTVN